MKDLEKDKIELRNSRRRVRTIGIAVLIVVSIVVFLPSASYDSGPMMILMITVWVILYIDYRLLKLKIEILQELSTEKEISESQNKIDS